jgi:hypothetical protein
MNCGEFVGIVKSGQPVILRRHSKEYIRLAENALSVVAEDGTHICLWLAANRKFKRILASFSHRFIIERSGCHSDFVEVKRFRETSWFLRKWQEMQEARDWTSTHNFPNLIEVATFVYLTLIPEYWMICLQRAGESALEASPLVEHEHLHTDTDGYDF